MRITDVQVFERGDAFSANIGIDDQFMLHLSEDGVFSIPESNEAIWQDELSQDTAHALIYVEKLVDLLRIPSDKEGLIRLRDMFDRC